jgi:hypothetical protein
MTERQRDEDARHSPARELLQSLVLIGVTVSSLAAPLGLAFAAVRVFASRWGAVDGRAPHVPVLADQAVGYLVPETGRDDGVGVDATVGAGGHAERLLDAMGPGGKLLGLDRDEEALAIARDRLARFGDRVRLIHANFDDLEDVVRSEGWDPLAGVLYELGVSSMHF